MNSRALAAALLSLAFTFSAVSTALAGGGPQNVVVVVNDASPESLDVANYYRIKRRIPDRNFCHLRLPSGWQMSGSEYEKTVLGPLRDHMKEAGLEPHVRFVVFTMGTPYRVNVESRGSTRTFP